MSEIVALANALSWSGAFAVVGIGMCAAAVAIVFIVFVLR
jgi:hypothetical protein